MMKKDNIGLFRANVAVWLGFIFIGYFFVGAYFEGAGRVDSNYPYAVLDKAPAHNPYAPVLRVTRPIDALTPYQVSPYGPGMEKELFELFIARNNYKIRWIVTSSFDEAIALLAANRCDLIIGCGGELAEEQKAVVAQGPVYTKFYPVMVGASEADSTGVFFAGAISGLRYIDDRNSKELPGSNETGQFLLNPATYAILVPINDNLRVKRALSEPVGHRWFWRDQDYDFRLGMLEFWQDEEIKASVNEMCERYYGFIPKVPKHGALRELSSVVSSRLGIYSGYIMEAATANDLDPLLLAAVIFQESRFNPGAVSDTGVRGIMQLTTDTAGMLNVDRLDPEQSIMGGARYLRFIWDSLEGFELTEWDRWCFTLAGFNQGPTIMRKALRTAQSMKIGVNWPQVRALYPRLLDMGIAGSGFRGNEAVTYVENVRYYYYVLSGLAAIARPEHKNLAAFLSAGA